MGKKAEGPETWSYTAGSRPYSVRVYEREPGGIIYAAAWDPSLRNGKGGERRRSLKHRDRDRAEEYADEQAKKLREAERASFAPRPTVRRVFRLYLRERTPDKASRTSRKDDERLQEMWTRLLGADFDLSNLSRREWDRFIRLRRSGEIDARGEPVTDPEKRRPVGNRTVEKDLRQLRAVIHWAQTYRDESGYLLMESDPTRGLDLPQEKNPSRPVATHDRVDAIREHYRKPRMEVLWNREREEAETFLPEIFEIVVGTGRRIGAVCQLRYEDLELDRTPATPYGAIIWPEDTDKMGKRWRCPITEQVREALESAIRKRPRVGPGPLFPAPRDASKPVRYELASSWLREAEQEAGLEPQEGTLWHAYRRLWATARKGLPDVDVARAGGWSSTQALRLAYQHPDDETMLRVVSHDAELREVR